MSKFAHSPQDWEKAAKLVEDLAQQMREGAFVAASIEVTRPPPPLIDRWYREGPDVSNILPYADEVTMTVRVEYGHTSVALDMNGAGVIVHHETEPTTE